MCCVVWQFVDVIVGMCWQVFYVSGFGEFFVVSWIFYVLVFWICIWQCVYIVGILYVVLIMNWVNICMWFIEVIGQYCEVGQRMYGFYVLVELGYIYVLQDGGVFCLGIYLCCLMNFIGVDVGDIFN